MNARFQNALRGTAQPIPPIWFMRQAGRYHKHYQNLRRQYSFMELCKKPDLAAEVALGPIQDFDFDVAILFSDLLFPLEALGFPLKYDPAPELGFTLDEGQIKNLRSIQDALGELQFQGEAMRKTRKVLPSDKSLIGFIGGPWTLFTYAVEGGHKGPLSTPKTSWSLYHKFCELLVPLLEKNIELQLAGGAEVVMIFDTAAGELSPALFRKYVEPFVDRLAQRFSGRVGYYSKGTTGAHLENLRRKTHFAGLGIDHRFDIAVELENHRHGFLQGNFDQALLFAPPADFERLLEMYLQDVRLLTPEQRRHWVCGLGHGVLPGTPEANVRAFISRVREVFSP